MTLQNVDDEGGVGQRFSGQVLVVDDNRAIQQLERKMLEGMGLTVSVAGDGAEAVALARQTSFDLLLLDMQIPVMDGVEVARTLRQQGSTIPIIAVTANVMEQHRRQFEAAGCDDYLEKPLELAELIDCIERYLGQRSSAVATTVVESEADATVMADSEEWLVGEFISFMHDFGNTLMALRPLQRELTSGKSQLEQLQQLLRQQQEIVDRGEEPQLNFGQLAEALERFSEAYLGESLDHTVETIGKMNERLRTQRQLIRERYR